MRRSLGRPLPWVLLGVLAVLLASAPVLVAAGDGDEDGEGGLLDGLRASKPKVVRPMPWEIPIEGEDACSDEEIVLLRELRSRSARVRRQEDGLQVREAALAALEERTAERMEELDAMRQALIGLLQNEQDGSEERVAELAKMVDAMKAKAAAPMLADLNSDLAVQVLRRIKAKQAGRVLAAMPVAKARELAERMTQVPDPRGLVAEQPQRSRASDADGAAGTKAGSKAGSKAGTRGDGSSDGSTDASTDGSVDAGSKAGG